MTKGAPIPQELHIAILTLHSIVHMQWVEISTHLKVHPENACQMIQRSKDRVGNEFFALLNDVSHDEPAHPPDPPQKYPEWSKESERLKEAAFNPENFGKNPVQLTHLAHLDVSPLTAYWYIHQHHNFAPYKPCCKPKLSQNNILSHIQFTDWALIQPQEHFVFTDETWIEIGSLRGRPNVWRPIGSDLYDFVIATDSGPEFTLMLSSHFAHEYRGEPYIWVKETSKEQEEHAQELEEENLRKQEHQEEMYANACTPGTEEYKILEAINTNIRSYNENRLPNEPRRMPQRPEWVFKEERGERSKGGGID
ncbi:hypothetical protein C7212DRAFT_344229 [Tuber magnatum]|uniref:Uncharacterized protein n=1 Tax=Tuber magnatum TaxID=42249 RepID=A0A317SQY2_9PEZI|nr:hypothetical protein C7212DRAFT_344229 [Tuber magnatum]